MGKGGKSKGKKATSSDDPQELKDLGNKAYSNGRLKEAYDFYT